MAIDETFPLLKIAIVGGGPGGLATAIALSKIPDVQVTLYEQAKVLREVGAGISIGQNTWNVLELLGVADSVTSGHPTLTVLNLNGTTGEELSRFEKKADTNRLPIRTQRTKLQSALLSHVPEGIIKLGTKVAGIDDRGVDGVLLRFGDGSEKVIDLVIGADGIRSVVRDAAWKDYQLKFTGTTIWRTLLPWDAVKDLDERFSTTAWWHSPTTHVYFSPVGEGLWEIAARAYQDPTVNAADKHSWGVLVANETVESHFHEYLPEIREALRRVPQGGWKEFAAFAGPELDDLTNWNDKVVLVGDSSHALSGAFGSGAGFAMEDGWVLAQALKANRNDVHKALPLFNKIRLPYYSRMYSHLAETVQGKVRALAKRDYPTPEDRVRTKIIHPGGRDMQWIYGNHIGKVWDESILSAA
ncbi:Putative FAD-binding domain, FAD/NAD(P)-binding domain superfamily [Septoria linicola]|uniref:FAD-binding domain, FAD/NAD(P)-binding domain superfamily n=1 Tax=Septoria linicola TaxID=215465 RepID=A0A9Q9EP65_9PEZI|nr:putative FAD-binding domain, FAD/NAD(P)-binding domain superfamily [Septoria linicola]USW57362.1 Putative FAD-binding domain, FAD/NAD(P)-binding domain superfamily [Septoria linicola]